MLKKTMMPYIERYINNKNYGGNYYEVIKRDNYSCKSCGAWYEDKRLNVHHIFGNIPHIKQSRDKSSLITLCVSCHRKEHFTPHSKITDDILKNIRFRFKWYNLINDLSNCTGKKKNKYSPYK